MSKKKNYVSNDIGLLEAFEVRHPEEYKTANICSSRAIDAIEGYASSLFMQSDLTYILYWLQLTTYVNFIMDGLTKQAENSYKTGIPNISR